MGAIWDFISGKSTDWDEFDAQQAKYRQSHPISKKIEYTAYCKICGVKKSGWNISDTDPAEVTRSLQNESGGCGRGNHIPVLVER